MIVEHPIFHMARLTLEAKTAHGIQSGRGDSVHDVLLVRDANGLPAIPGTSLAGVLRHAYARKHGDAAADRLFGTISGDGRPSSLYVDWGIVHDSHDRPREGMLDPDDLANDPLLAYLQLDKPIIRQRVRLDHRGAASQTGKFDVTLLPAGVRYTHWLSYWRDDSDESAQQWQQLLALMGKDGIQLGHGTRSGNGHFQAIQLESAVWDLRTAEGRKGFSSRPRCREDRNGLSPISHVESDIALHVDLCLQADAGWRVGGGERSLLRHEKEPDLLPQHEPFVNWSEGHGHVSMQQHLLPGSAVKGALRHRVAYHYRRLRGEWADESLPSTDECAAVQQLFGSSTGDTGTAGLLRFQDMLMPKTTTKVLMHNRIDRFTGGVMHGALFSEEVLWQTPLSLRIKVVPHREVDLVARQALQSALVDLSKGRLPLGAAGSRGLGTLRDPEGNGPAWSDGGAWLQGQEANSARSVA